MPGIEPKVGPCDQYSGAPAISGLPEAAMDYQRFLLHFEGRINRARYWLAVLIILCSMIFALLSLAIISAFFGIATGPLTIDIVGVSASFDLDPDTAVKGGPVSASRHHSDDAAFRMVLCGRLGQAASRPQQERLVDDPLCRRDRPLRSVRGWLGGASFFVGLPVFIAMIWGFVEMYYLKGTSGPNRFGPDPLPKVQTRPRSGLQSGQRSASTWDQQSEIEFMPHISGPSPGPHVKRSHD
jgi:uncharacterized membrane protein YhaH (DUF805 family)